MIVGELKDGRRKKVSCVCDECLCPYVVREDSAKRGRKRRGGDIDLCSSCSHLPKYKKTPLSRRGAKHTAWIKGYTFDNGYKKIQVYGRGK